MLTYRKPLANVQRLLLLLLLLHLAFISLTDAQVKKRQATVTRKTSVGKRRSKDGRGQRPPVALSSKKETRATMAQAKIDSQLLYVLKIRRGEKSPVADVQSLERSIKIDGQGRTLIDLEASVSDDLLREIQRLGGEIISSFKQFNAIRANFPIDKLEELAALRDIKFIRPATAPTMDTPVHGF